MQLSGRDNRIGSRRRCRLKVFTTRGVLFTLDVGQGGFCAQVLRVLPPGTPLEGNFHVDDANLPFSGRVVWAKGGDPHLNVRGKMGIALARGAAELEAVLAARRASLPERSSTPAAPGASVT
jgi:hypothetical protein